MKAKRRRPPRAGPSPRPRRAPRLRSYIALNLCVWGFLALQAWVLTQALRSARSIVLLSLLEALGFAAVTVFDYVWLRLGGERE